MHYDHPFHLDSCGRTASTDDADHVRDLIEQLLFTSPGERVNRPSLGGGLRSLLFAPASEELATATQYLLLGVLNQWLSELILVEAVRVEVSESRLEVTVQYLVRRTQQRRSTQIIREV